jgi:4-amino-4-deoxy-L-arabinose transferase-like glycosyltransferase
MLEMHAFPLVRLFCPACASVVIWNLMKTLSATVLTTTHLIDWNNGNRTNSSGAEAHCLLGLNVGAKAPTPVAPVYEISSRLFYPPLAFLAGIASAAGVLLQWSPLRRMREISGVGDTEGGLAPAARSTVSVSQDNSSERRLLRLWYGLCLLLAVFTYFYALDSPHIPKNGDEYVYAHITRFTAYSGHLLPLESQLHEMRNTKPPLLIWQGLASTRWAKDWSLVALRYPSVIYTLLTAGMVFLLAWKSSGRLETSVLACLVYLSFFNTYRYGRPFLTEAPVTFWLFAPFFAFLFWQPIMLESRVLMPVLLGLGLGVGLLYKSFALVLPVALAFAWWYLDYRGYKVRAFLAKDAGKIAIMGVVSLAMFGLWFLLDPKPMEIVREFVVVENLGKFDAKGTGYLTQLVRGASSVWGMGLAYLLNAGLLVFPVVALLWVSYKRRRELSGEEKLMWLWILSLFLFFSLPSMRSGRYLLPAMPAFALLCALNWERISRKAFVASLLAAGAAIAAMAYLSLRLESNLGAMRLFPLAYWPLMCVTAAIVLVALFVPRFTRPGVLGVALLLCLCLAVALRPLDGPLGRYGPDAQQYAVGKQVWVPCNFRAVDEGYRFLLPGADIHGYRDDGNVTLDSLDTRYAMFAIRQPIGAMEPRGLRLIGQRLEIHSRLSSRELMDMLRGNVFNQLFVRELLVEVPGAQAVASPSDLGCR